MSEYDDDMDDDDFDIVDEEQEAIELMMAWRNSSERPPLRRELDELRRILDRELGPAEHDVDGDSDDDPQELADMGYGRDDLEDMGYDSDDLDDIEWPQGRKP
jgi:hypothetical protein